MPTTPLIAGIPTTDNRMALMEAPQKADDGSCLRSLVETAPTIRVDFTEKVNPMNNTINHGTVYWRKPPRLTKMMSLSAWQLSGRLFPSFWKEELSASFCCVLSQKCSVSLLIMTSARRPVLPD